MRPLCCAQIMHQRREASLGRPLVTYRLSLRGRAHTQVPQRPVELASPQTVAHGSVAQISPHRILDWLVGTTRPGPASSPLARLVLGHAEHSLSSRAFAA